VYTSDVSFFSSIIDIGFRRITIKSKMQDSIESRMKLRGLHTKEAIVDWLSRQEWKENDHIYFFIAGFIFWSIYVFMIMSNFYGVYDFKDYWLIPCGLGIISFVFTAWSYESLE